MAGGDWIKGESGSWSFYVTLRSVTEPSAGFAERAFPAFGRERVAGVETFDRA